MPEVPNNVDMTTGNLGLTDQEENQIVAFLETLTTVTRHLPRQQYLYGSMPDRWHCCDAG